MIIEQALRERLLSRADIVALVGQRIQQGLALQGEDRPFISYETDGGEHEYHTLGTSELTTARFELHCCGNTYWQSRVVYDAVRDAVDGFGNGLWGDVFIDSAFLDVPTQNRNQPQHGRERPLPVLSATLEVRYLQSIPAHQQPQDVPE